MHPFIFNELITPANIPMRFKPVIVFCLLFISLVSTGQVNFFRNALPVTLPDSALSYYRDTGYQHSFEQYLAIKNKMGAMLKNDVNLSYKNEMLWLKIPMELVDELHQIRYLMVRNPHINYLGCWIIKEDSILQEFALTGDHLPFASRNFRNPNFVFTLAANDLQNTSLLLLIDKRYQQLNLPVHFFTEEGFASHNQYDNLLAGIITGLGVFIFILNLFLFFKMKEWLYVYYGLYVLSVFFYIISDFGLSFMYLFPSVEKLADVSRPMALSFAGPLYVLFCLQLLNTKQTMPEVYTWAKRFLYLYFIVLIVGILLMPGKGQLTLFLLSAMQIAQNLNLLVVIIIAAIGLKKKLPYSGYMILTSMILLSFFLIYMKYLSGYIADNLFTRNSANLGFSVETAILAFVLTLRFKDYKERNESLLIEVNVQQEQIFKSLSDFQEQERLRLSSIMHDSLGANLSAIRLNLESLSDAAGNEKIKGIIAQVNYLANDVRQMSHGLSPILLQQRGLVNSLKHFIDGINSGEKLYVQFESIGTQQHISFRYEILVYNVIQELLQNIMKHSGATEAIVQLMLENELVSIFVEDNGIGFEETMIKEGLGFFQIKQLVKFVKGSFRVKANKESGCQVTIEFPILPDERNHSSTYS